MTNASDRRKLPAGTNEIDIFDASGFGTAVLAPDGNMRVPLIDNTTYRCHGTFPIPLLLMPKRTTPGALTVISLIGFDTCLLLVDGSDIPHIWGREVSAIGIQRVSFADISNAGSGRGSVLFDLVGGNGPLSFMTATQSTLSSFKVVARLVDVAVGVSAATQDIGNDRGWVLRCNPGAVSSHFFSNRQFSGLPFLPDNRSAGISFLGQTPSVSIAGCSVKMGKAANPFLFIDSSTPAGSYSIVGNNFPGGAGAFFRPDEVATITAQADASVTVSSFADSTAAPGVDTTVAFAGIVDVTRGQIVEVVGGTYAGSHTVIRVADDQLSFDITFVFAGASAGTLGQTEHTVSMSKYVRDETVTISGTTNYDGTVLLLRTGDTTFVTPQEFLGGPEAGTATSTGKDHTSPGVGSIANGAQANSQARGGVCWNGNTTDSSVANGVYGPINTGGAMPPLNAQRFTLSNATTGELTYNGLGPFSGEWKMRFHSQDSPPTETYRFAISIDGTPPTFGAVEEVTLDLRQAGDEVTGFFQVILNPGQTIQPMVAGVGTATDFAILEGQITISGA